MKKYLVAIAVLVSLASLTSCQKEQPHTKFPTPDWKEDQTGKYPVSMTAVVSLYYSIAADMQPDDKCAAFVNDECRGVGTLVKISPVSSAFFILIHGTAAEQSKVRFKYYSTKTSYMYTTQDAVDFKIDSNFGTADSPQIVDFKVTN